MEALGKRENHAVFTTLDQVLKRRPFPTSSSLTLWSFGDVTEKFHSDCANDRKTVGLGGLLTCRKMSWTSPHQLLTVAH